MLHNRLSFIPDDVLYQSFPSCTLLFIVSLLFTAPLTNDLFAQTEDDDDDDGDDGDDDDEEDEEEEEDEDEMMRMMMMMTHHSLHTIRGNKIQLTSNPSEW